MAYLYWNFMKRKDPKHEMKMFISVLIIIEVIHPSLINTTIEAVTCTEIDGFYYLKSDYYYECYELSHILKVIKYFSKV